MTLEDDLALSFEDGGNHSIRDRDRDAHSSIPPISRVVTDIEDGSMDCR